MSATIKTILTDRSKKFLASMCNVLQVMRWCFHENFLCLSMPAVAKVTLSQGHALLFHCIVTLHCMTVGGEDKIHVS